MQLNVLPKFVWINQNIDCQYYSCVFSPQYYTNSRSHDVEFIYCFERKITQQGRFFCGVICF